MSNINDIFFDGQYKDIWKALIPEELTIRETKFFIEYFNLKPGQHVLDLMCGYGRHALSLARNGIHVTAVDNLKDYINEIKLEAKKQSLNIEAIQSTILNYPLPKDKFDLAFCMGNSLNFFNLNDTTQIIQSVSNSLKSKAYFLLHSWSLSEIVNNKYTDMAEGEIDGAVISTISHFRKDPNRIETATRIVSKDGTVETKEGIDYIFSIDELEDIFKENGLVIKEVFSVPGKKRFKEGDLRAYIIAQRVG